MTTMIERVAAAIDAADVGYSLRLTRLVDDVSTYTLMYSDGVGPFEFEDIDDGYAHIRDRKFVAKARAAIAAMREPTDGMLAGTEAPGAWGAEPRFVVPVGYENGPIYREQCAEIYQAMIDAALEEKP